MPDLVITGAGILMGSLRTQHVASHLVANQPDPQKIAATDEMLLAYQKEIAKKIAREDRSILNNASAQCLLSAIDAFDMAEQSVQINKNMKENFGVFTSAERDREYPSDLWNLIYHGQWDQPPTIETVIARLGELKNSVHPLGIFKKLSTNPLYHISKYFHCRGGGYPIQRMSLGGLCMLEEASSKIFSNSMHGAILSAYGNMNGLDNILAFRKMGLIREGDNQDGIVPASGSASVILETLSKVEQRGGAPLAKVKRVKTKYSSLMHAGESEWLQFYEDNFSDLVGTSPIVILYDNGVSAAGNQERSAIEQFFGSPRHISYKKFTGYTGQANNLIDLVLALADPSIPSGQPILLNGIGTSSGMGSMLFEKCIDSLPSNTREA